MLVTRCFFVLLSACTTFRFNTVNAKVARYLQDNEGDGNSTYYEQDSQGEGNDDYYKQDDQEEFNDDYYKSGNEKLEEGPADVDLDLSTWSLRFTYEKETSELGYGLKEWNLVDEDQYYFPWERYTGRLRGNKCRYNDDEFRQSPIDITNENNCDDPRDDQHRWWTNHGTCQWPDLKWEIKPFGLMMTYPMPRNDRVNPERTPCIKPWLDSSGGYGDRFFGNYVLLKSPAEHSIHGKKYDAEITLAFFRWRSNKPFIISVLIEADESYPDNPILQPYLHMWQNEHDRIFSNCTARFGGDPRYRLDSLAPTLTPTSAPSISTSPSSTPSISLSPSVRPPPCVERDLSTLDQRIGGERTDHEGIMFDISSTSDKDIVIYQLDLNIQGKEEHVFQVWVKNGTHVGFENDDDAWEQVGDDDRVMGAGINEPSALMLQNPIILPAGQTMAIYVVQMNADNVQNIYYRRSDKGKKHIHAEDDFEIAIGSAIKGKPFEAEAIDEGRGFSGVIHYRMCSYEFDDPEIDTIDDSLINEKTFVNETNDGGRFLRQGARRLDHGPRDRAKGPFDFAKDPDFAIFRLLPTPFFYRYRGSFTMPQCFNDVRWRICEDAMRISLAQLEQINIMQAEMRDPDTCLLSTVGKELKDTPRLKSGTHYVSTARPIQPQFENDLKHCTREDWNTVGFFRTPRANTRWDLLESEGLQFPYDKYT